MFGDEKTCQISQGLITGLITILTPMSSVCYAAQDLVFLSTLKDQSFHWCFLFLKLHCIKKKSVHRKQVISS